MKIVIDTVPHAEQRYVTLGDYFITPDGTRHISVSDLGDERMELLIALHEIVEMFLTEGAGISEREILDFDLDHPELDDPGNDPRAVYHEQHVTAEGVERIMAALLGVKWADYTARCEAL